MRTIYLTLTTLALLLLLSCCHENDTILTFDTGSKKLINSKLEFYSNGGNANLFFTTNKEAQPIISIDYLTRNESEWLSAKGFVDSGNGEITIHCDKNNTLNKREASIHVAVDDANFTIKVIQRPAGTANTTYDAYVVGKKKQTKEIEFTSNGKLTFSLRFDRPIWIKYDTIEQEEKVKLLLSIEPNEGLGRIAFIDVYVDGIKHSSISVRQQPATFSPDVVIPAVEAGSLYVLLGDEEANIRHIRNLTISGSLNALDLYVLKQRLFLSGLIARSYPLQLDLYETYILEGYKSYYSDLKIELPDNLPSIEEASLSSETFAYVDNIASLELPGYLEKIGPYCFRGCTGLERINIPDDVTVIGEYAFKGCSELKKINITPFSKLASLGDYAFATGTRLKSLYLPIGLTHISELAFKSCHVDSLYLDWETPPILKVVPKGETLSVPSGSRQAYESTPGWSNFKNIVEHNP
ncbi:leucine-rich repeat protein [uncultured Bacteroides sp.]|mgnify:CR=1 FL=1|uniref:leucine-rich repeat protein n=1 Tax=uncultured Bacteroides sp. TaxID=162156 RepID=UPI0025885353|nr:leucine-rich repeat protein [uncultured Bacteroides sp.]